MSINSLYTTPFSSTDTTSQKWRIAIKTSGSAPINFTTTMIFRINTSAFYTPAMASSEIGLNYMTICHAGTNSGNGFGLFLKYVSNQLYLCVRYILKSGTTWIEALSANLETIANINTHAFLIKFSYIETNQISHTIFLSILDYDTPLKTSFDYSQQVTISGTGTQITLGNQFGFGSSPESITSKYGIITTNSYNSCVAQGVYYTKLIAWDALIPDTAIGTNYGIFNTTNSNYSVYNYYRSNTDLPYNGTNLIYQLDIPSNLLSALTNNAINTPETSVTLTSSVTGYSPLPNFGVNNTNYTLGAGNITVALNSINCLLRNTKIKTPSGYVLIQDLKKGDLVLSGFDEILQIKNIYKIIVLHNEETEPIVIRKGQFGAFEDLYLASCHAILLGDEFIYPFQLIVDKNDNHQHSYEFWHIATNDYFKDTLVANGVIVEVYGELPYLTKEEHINYDIKYKNQLNEKGNRKIIR